MAAATIKICSFLLIAILFMCSEAKYDYQLKKETKMSMYFHDFAGGANSTNALVSGIPGMAWGYFNFGTVSVGDDSITEDAEINSTEIGRGQNVYVISSLDGSTALALLSISFTNKEYKGSTLQLQGTDLQTSNVTELAVVSGTGKLRFARGYAIFEILHYEPSVFYSLIRVQYHSVTVPLIEEKIENMVVIVVIIILTMSEVLY